MVALLAAAEVDFDEVVSLITGDPALTYRVLRATNAAASGVRHRVSSVREAVVLLGLPTIRQWVTLMLLGEVTEGAEDRLVATMTRARMCQTVGRRAGLSGDAAFSVGLLSGVAELIGLSPADVVHQLPLSEEVGAALADRAGPLGQVLTAVCDYSDGNAAGLADLLGPDAAVNAYLTAMKWCNEVMTAAGPADTFRPSPASV
jgi:EAL and modified HD-GYP domain-containing signal transduction protein